MKNFEIESKVKAHISESEFISKLDGYTVEFIRFRGTDHFFGLPADNKMHNSFYRFREDNHKKELTYKERVNDSNILIRQEPNILVADSTDLETVKAFLLASGYKYVYSLYKEGIIILRDQLIFSYYKANDMNFIEVEVHSEVSDNKNDNYEILYYGEKLLNITPNMRINKSLVEICHPNAK